MAVGEMNGLLSLGRKPESFETLHNFNIDFVRFVHIFANTHLSI